jgi:hypothetical protein
LAPDEERDLPSAESVAVSESASLMFTLPPKTAIPQFPASSHTVILARCENFADRLRTELMKVEGFHQLLVRSFEQRLQQLKTLSVVSLSASSFSSSPMMLAEPDHNELLLEIEKWDDYRQLNSTAVYKILKKCMWLHYFLCIWFHLN